MNQTNMIVAVIIIVIAALLVGLYAGSHLASSTQQQYTTAASSQQTTVQSSLTTSQTNTTNSTHKANTSTSYTVKLATSARVGMYLVNATGYTLYLNSQDTPTSSSCYGQCAYYWHAFYTPNIVVPSGLNPSKFGTMTRTGGALQTTYYGYPLYTYSVDNASGQMTGQGVAGTWFVVTYPNLTT